MEQPALIFFCLLLLVSCWPFSDGNSGGGRCSSQGKRNNTIDLTIFSTRNKTGNWTTSFIADQGIHCSSNGAILALQRTVIECEGTHVLRIAGLLQDFDGEGHRHILQPKYKLEDDLRKEERERCGVPKVELLKFDPVNKGRKAVISEDGRTAYRKTPKDDSMEYGSLITNRILREEEVFQLKIEETIQERNADIVAFGLTAVIPADIKTNCHISDSKNGTWAVRADSIIKDSATIKSSYLLDTRKLQVGTIIGLMRKKNGDLHFYKNGQDMGLAATNLPSKMYGIFDMRDHITKVSIVE